VRWRNFGAEEDSWIPTENFHNMKPVNAYWKRTKEGNKTKSEKDDPDPKEPKKRIQKKKGKIQPKGKEGSDVMPPEHPTTKDK